MLSLTDLDRLLSAEGQRALAEAAEVTPANLLRTIDRLTRQFDRDLARAAVDQAQLRQRARAKFPLADRMYFTRDGLEQATSAAVAQYRARRLAGTVVEACCGIGGDTQALAARGTVIAIDSDPLRLRLAEENVRVAGLADHAQFLLGDLTTLTMPAGDVLMFDPDRRATGRRSASLRDLQPPLSLLSAWSYPGAVVKLAPATPWSELGDLDAGIEFISLDGELKECVAWFGQLHGPRRRATVLPAGEQLQAEIPAPGCEAGEPRTYLYDPDPAVTRSGLVTNLAEQLDATPIDETIAFLTSDRLVRTPLARAYHVCGWMPFHLGRLRESLRSDGVGHVTVIKRGSAVDVNTLTRELRLAGPASRTVFLTRVLGRPAAVVAESLDPTDVPR